MVRIVVVMLIIFDAMAFCQTVVDTNNAAPAAIMKGVSISTETGDTKDETVVSCYFVFDTMPTSYYYEVNLKDRTICFEYNDATGNFHYDSTELWVPMKSIFSKSTIVNINKDIKGSLPEYHHQASVCFQFEKVPKITVSDEASMISFSYSWSSDSSKIREYEVVESKHGYGDRWWLIVDKIAWAALFAVMFFSAR